tara:strand:- start:19880 stop:20476 length:597 start_codon:yes stop_codon:yes gene_type:complete
MAQQLINTGTTPGDDTGTKLYLGGDIINENFTELYTEVGLKRNGIYNYNDVATVGTPIAVTGGGGSVALTNDGLGAQTQTFPATGVTDVWDEGTQSFDFSELTLGTKVTIRLDILITTTSPNQNVDITMDLAVGGSFPFTIGWDEKVYKNTAAHNFVVSSFIYIGSTDIQTNGGVFMIESDSDADVTVNGWSCSVIPY